MKQAMTGVITKSTTTGRTNRRAVRNARFGRTAWGLPVVAAALLGAPSALAQSKFTDGEFSVQRFDPAPGPRNFLSTRGARIDGHMAWSAGLTINYAGDPFIIKSCSTQSDCDSPSAAPGRAGDLHLVDKMITGDFLGSLTLINRVQIGLKVPVSFVHGDGLGSDGFAKPGGLSGAGLGDIELQGKVRLYGELRDPVVIGGEVFVTAPTGHATASYHYIGDQTPIVGLRGIFDGRQGPFSFGANLAGLYRGSGRVGSVSLGSEFRYGVGLGYEASPVFRVILDGFGGTKFSAENGSNSLELDGGIGITPLSSPIGIIAAAGPGILQGVGVPTFRAIVGVSYTAESRDRDGDGIPDNADQCPTEPEDKDGFEDADGCPDRDNDGDGIPDKDDKCPNQAEDQDGFQDNDGCPDPDNDADGVDDAHDQCPDKKETMNGFKDDDGCPDEPDRDGDGVPDSKDQCPDQAEDTDGFQDTDGCPDPDNDGDGIPDEDDECVDEPETKNGFQDEDGCPDDPKTGRKGKPTAKAIGAAPPAAATPATPPKATPPK
ncbi:MAG TPA: thrombospondin type 3 repeat-containing protein [Polyangiaceae bacterium]|jgi:hypothetical protein|nr:thrombospondin type 3 repeat-containing protein [Polyangiaceae bacterium]